jgi:hypothetical protein
MLRTLLGCYETARDEPMAKNIMVTPSIFHLKDSPRKIGDRIAVKIMVKLVVPLISMILATLIARALKT